MSISIHKTRLGKLSVLTLPNCKTVTYTVVDKATTRTHLPRKCSEGCTGVRGPGDDKKKDDDECDLGHFPLALHPMEPLHRVSVSLTVDLCDCSVKHMHTLTILLLFSMQFIFLDRNCHLNVSFNSRGLLLYFTYQLIHCDSSANWLGHVLFLCAHTHNFLITDIANAAELACRLSETSVEIDGKTQTHH